MRAEKKKAISSLVILFLVMLLIWLPYIFKVYGIISAIAITISTLTAEFVAHFVLKKCRKKANK